MNDKESTKGWKQQKISKRNRNRKVKKYNIEETDSGANRYSRLIDMVGEVSKVMQLLSAVVKQQDNNKEK